MKIVVLMGGVSEEREVSLASGVQVVRALRNAGHDVMGVDTSHGVLSAAEEVALLESGIKDPHPAAHTRDLLRTGDIAALTRDPRIVGTDVVFLTLHGGGGEDGTIQTLLESGRDPLCGERKHRVCAGYGQGSLKADPERCRDSDSQVDHDLRQGRGDGSAGKCLRGVGIPCNRETPLWRLHPWADLAHDPEELPGALELALEYEDRVLFEEYVRGRELTVGILGEEALPVGEIIPEHEIFDYECKYRDGMAQEIFPAVLDREVARNVQAAALAAHRVLRLRDFSRVDFILDQKNKPWCLEANALPGLTGNSLLPKAAREAGISFPELCHRLAEMALIRSGS